MTGWVGCETNPSCRLQVIGHLKAEGVFVGDNSSTHETVHGVVRGTAADLSPFPSDRSAHPLIFGRRSHPSYEHWVCAAVVPLIFILVDPTHCHPWVQRW